jgi:Transposase DDE domain
VIDRQVWIAGCRLPCRLIAWRLPPKVAARRRRKLRAQVRRKEGKGAVPSAERLARCDWAILLTNVPEERLSIDEARVLYRARWQIELLFKRWKSQGRIDEMDSSPIRCMVKLWSRLLAALLQQWLQSRLWGRPEISLKKAWDLISRLVDSLALAWRTTATHGGNDLRDQLERIERIAEATARQNKRKQPNAFELLIDPSKLPYALT